jgi:hypothetical protein
VNGLGKVSNGTFGNGNSIGKIVVMTSSVMMVCLVAWVDSSIVCNDEIAHGGI